MSLIINCIANTEMDQCRASFTTPEARQSMLHRPRQLPIKDKPAEFGVAVVEWAYML